MPLTLYIYTQSKLDRFREHLSIPDVKLLSNFDLLLTGTELEVRGGTAKDQYQLLCRRHQMQKIATSYLNVEIAMYGSIFSFYPNDRVGVFF